MEKYKILFQIRLGANHKSTGKTSHYELQGNVKTPILNITQLQIAKYPDAAGYYLLYLDKNGEELTDTYHENIESAMQQAEWEFSVKANEWQEVK